ncbi:MAG: MerR family transcriptional regulator [Bacteroidales bacterium]|nr:MerR family transcriptional regulator [Bacteroidales bacterium]
MSNKIRLKIGEFSRLMQVTVKTLRHYEQKELLIPEEVDEWTGYRYYSITQMQKLNLIRHLQQLGFTLDEIKDLFDNESHFPSIEQLTEKHKETERQLKLLMTRRNQLHEWISSRKKIKKMENKKMNKFSIESLPEMIVASHRGIIANYSELGKLCCTVIGPEMLRLGCKCPLPGYCFTIEHNEEYTPTDIDIEYCEQIEEMGTDSSIIQFKKLPAVAKVLCMKHYGPYERFYESFTEAFAYIEEQGYKVTDKARVSYIDGIWNQEDPEKWLSIIQIPIE